MKIYALEASIKNFHIHRLRRTIAKIVSEVSESIADTQEALGCSNIKIIQIYVQRLAVKKDKFSNSIREVSKNKRLHVLHSSKSKISEKVRYQLRSDL